MSKIRFVLITTAILSAQLVFANHDMLSSSSRPCAIIAKACLQAGFVRTEELNKQFWQSCMKPLLLGQPVQGVTVNSATVKICRANKIDELKKELKALEKASK